MAGLPNPPCRCRRLLLLLQHPIIRVQRTNRPPLRTLLPNQPCLGGHLLLHRPNLRDRKDVQILIPKIQQNREPQKPNEATIHRGAEKHRVVQALPGFCKQGNFGSIQKVQC